MLNNKDIRSSVWKSSYKTGKRPRPDRTWTDQDRKFSGPIKTASAVRSSVSCIFRIFKTDENRSQPVSTGLYSLENRVILVRHFNNLYNILAQNSKEMFHEITTKLHVCQEPSENAGKQINNAKRHWSSSSTTTTVLSHLSLAPQSFTKVWICFRHSNF